VIEGHSNKVIAQHLGLTEAAVKVQLESLLRRINVDNRTQAVIWALGKSAAAVAAQSRRGRSAEATATVCSKTLLEYARQNHRVSAVCRAPIPCVQRLLFMNTTPAIVAAFQ
jgi:predicted transcriptional regulator